MDEQSIREPLRPSVFYAESLVRCTLQQAWRMIWDYRIWNPEFACAETTLVSGLPRTEGELILITRFGEDRAPVTQFFAETIKVVAPHHIVWYVFPVGGDSFRNFGDFALEEAPSGVKFRIFYYAQNAVSAQELAQLRADTQTSVDNLTIAFKNYCEAQSSRVESML